MGMEEVLDEDGNISETNVPIYSDPIELKANISVEEGRAFRESTSVEMFGIDVFYDKVIVVDDPDFLKGEVENGTAEATIFYVDKPPYKDGQISDAFDYRVARVSRSLNSTAIAVKRVDVS